MGPSRWAKEPYIRWESRSPTARCILRMKNALEQCNVHECGIGCAKTAEPIKLPFCAVSGMGPRNRVLLDGCTYWRHLANMVERLYTAAICKSATRGGDAACFQITGQSCLIVLLCAVLCFRFIHYLTGWHLLTITVFYRYLRYHS